MLRPNSLPSFSWKTNYDVYLSISIMYAYFVHGHYGYDSIKSWHLDEKVYCYKTFTFRYTAIFFSVFYSILSFLFKLPSSHFGNLNIICNVFFPINFTIIFHCYAFIAPRLIVIMSVYCSSWIPFFIFVFEYLYV